jgi:hypothetical protein
MSGSRLIAETVRRPTDAFASRLAIATSGQNPKVRLLLLCARIGYTPHASFQR